MRRIVIAIGLCGLLAACGQEAQAPGSGGAPGQQLDYIDAVPITEDETPPVAQPQTADKKEEPEEEREEDKADAEAASAPAATPTPEPAAPSADAATATRRANEAVAPRSATEVPYSPN